MKNLPKISIFGIIFLLSLFFVTPIFAATIPYTITPGIQSHIIFGPSSTFFTSEFKINYQGGKIILSSNPDGTGNVWVDDILDILIKRPNGTFDYFTKYFPDGFCASLGSLVPQDITRKFGVGENSVKVTMHNACGIFVGSSPIYLVNINSPDPTPSPTPTPSPSPTSSPAPSPFLDLPWDYQGDGLSFNEAANAMTSFFDHKYPLLSSGISEPQGSLNSIFKFEGIETTESYSSHDGYDYGKKAGAAINEPVLAAGDGTATLGNKDDCGACGNYILIDHGNSYQSRYYHMQADGLIAAAGEEIQVTKGQQIGKVGATGNVSPAGDAGAHIHFMVVQDKDEDGEFDDNLAGGVTDPFGWQSKEADPWPSFEFKNPQTGEVLWTGNKSFYLWLKKLDNLDATLTSNGGVFKTERYTLDFPENATIQNLNLSINSSPTVNIGDTLSSIGSTIIATAEDLFGNIVTQFLQPFTLIIDFSSFDLTRYNTNTLSIYSSEDGINWSQIPTEVDFANFKASAQIDHFTHFALLAERIDTTAPTTTANLSGDQGQSNWFRSDVAVSLNADDGEGLGVDYTMYRLPGNDWGIYTTSLIFTFEGHYKIEFYSADNDENLEEIKTVEFDIDKTKPEVSVDTNLKYLWPPNGKLFDVLISGSSVDEYIASTQISVDDEYDLIEPQVLGFNQTIKLESARLDSDLDGRLYIINVMAEDLAGNKTSREANVVVPHDQGVSIP